MIGNLYTSLYSVYSPPKNKRISSSFVFVFKHKWQFYKLTCTFWNKRVKRITRMSQVSNWLVLLLEVGKQLSLFN